MAIELVGTPVRNFGNRSVGVALGVTYGTAIPEGALIVAIAGANANSDTLFMADANHNADPRSWTLVNSTVNTATSTGPVLKVWRRTAGANEDVNFYLGGTNSTVWGLSIFVLTGADNNDANWSKSFTTGAELNTHTTGSATVPTGGFALGAFSFDGLPGSASSPDFNNSFVRHSGQNTADNVRLQPIYRATPPAGSLNCTIGGTTPMQTARYASMAMMAIPEALPSTPHTRTVGGTTISGSLVT